MPVRINIQPQHVQARVMGAWNDNLAALSEEILADCNEYCKEDQGTLISSSLTHSIPAEGKLIWQTPYARRQYWEITTSLTPGRTFKWCETAKRTHFRTWQAQAQRGLRHNL